MVFEMILPDIHEKQELLSDLDQRKNGFVSNEIIQKWFLDRYSTSKHLWVLYSIVYGLKCIKMAEVGFGRSSFVLAKAAYETGAHFICCDRYDYTGYLSPEERGVMDFVVGDAKKLYNNLNCGLDFVFLDYLSSKERSAESCYKALKRWGGVLRQNGIIAVHEAVEKGYNVMEALKMFRRVDGYEQVSLPYNYGLAIIRKTAKSEYGRINDEWLKKNPKKHA